MRASKDREVVRFAADIRTVSDIIPFTVAKPKKIVVKVGSSTVTDTAGRVDHANLRALVGQIAAEVALGTQCLLVTSGAIAAGVERLGLEVRPSDIAKMQAAAAVGQGLLIHEYTNLFREHGLHTAQILLTQFDMAHRELYLNARRAISEIISMGAVPVVNENDTTAVEELKFGDNDTIAALVAVLVEADLLIILSDTDGFYSGDPRKGDSVRLTRVDSLTPEIEAMASGIGTQFGSGGMITKIHAARIAGAARIGMYIADGRDPEVLRKILSGDEVGTYFVPKKTRVSERKLWIGFGRTVRGRVTVDAGAAKAIMGAGGSLLPAGITGHSGDFAIGDTIEVAGPDGTVIARGSSNYASVELTHIKGKKSDQIAGRLGEDFSEEVIHRDFMVVL